MNEGTNTSDPFGKSNASNAKYSANVPLGAGYAYFDPVKSLTLSTSFSVYLDSVIQPDSSTSLTYFFSRSPIFGLT